MALFGLDPAQLFKDTAVGQMAPAAANMWSTLTGTPTTATGWSSPAITSTAQAPTTSGWATLPTPASAQTPAPAPAAPTYQNPGAGTQSWTTYAPQQPAQQPTYSVAPTPQAPAQDTTYRNPGNAAPGFWQEAPQSWSSASPQWVAPTWSNTGTSGGVLSGPGTAEQWWTDNKSRYSAPTALSQYWNGVQGTLQNQNFAPTTSQGAYGSLYGQVSSPGAGATNAQTVAGQLRTAGAGEGYMGQAAGYFQQPSTMANFANQTLGSGYFQAPSASEQYYQQTRGQLGQQGAGVAAAGNTLNGANYGAQSIGVANAAIPGAMNTQALYNNVMPGFANQNMVGSEYGHFAEGLRDPSYSEKLYESGNQGLNTFYDRERAKRQEALETRMAAMGVFGSGDTAKAMYELEGELGAAQARDMAGLAAQADQARLGRAGEARAFSGAAGQEALGRMGLAAETAGRADSNRINLLAQQLEAQGMASQEALQKAQQYAKLDEQELARLRLGGELAQSSSQEGRARLTDAAQIANLGDKASLERAQGLASTGQALSAAELSRLQASGQLGLSADAANLARTGQAWDMSTDLDAARLAGIQAQQNAISIGGNIAAGTSQLDASRLGQEFNAAQSVQNLFENRNRNQLQDVMGMATAKANTVAAALSGADAERFMTEINAINAQVAQGALTSQQGAQRMQDTFATYEMLIRAGTAGQPKPTTATTT